MLSDRIYEDLLQHAKSKASGSAPISGGTASAPTAPWSVVPYAEPSSLQGHASPYYTAAHHAWRRKCRAFVDEHLTPHVADWDEAGAVPDELRRKMYEAGMLAVIWPASHGGTPPAGSEPAGQGQGQEQGAQQWAGAWRGSRVDPFFDLIHMDELARCGSGGLLANIFSFGIGLPPILMFGSEAMQAKVCRPVITGEKQMCLCITEPGGGSDVAQLRTTATRDEATGDFIVTGQKKWITGVR